MDNYVKREDSYGPSPVEKIPVNYHDSQFDSYYECSKCHEVVRQLQKYCGECGSRLDWDMEKMGRC